MIAAYVTLVVVVVTIIGLVYATADPSHWRALPIGEAPAQRRDGGPYRDAGTVPIYLARPPLALRAVACAALATIPLAAIAMAVIGAATSAARTAALLLVAVPLEVLEVLTAFTLTQGALSVLSRDTRRAFPEVRHGLHLAVAQAILVAALSVVLIARLAAGSFDSAAFWGAHLDWFLAAANGASLLTVGLAVTLRAVARRWTATLT